jgi:hypothetical protein
VARVAIGGPVNEWLDGDGVPLLQRLQEHLRIKKYPKYVESEWGEEGLEEYRNHLDDDFRVFIATLRSILKKVGQARNSNE